MSRRTTVTNLETGETGTYKDIQTACLAIGVAPESAYRRLSEHRRRAAMVTHSVENRGEVCLVKSRKAEYPVLYVRDLNTGREVGLGSWVEFRKIVTGRSPTLQTLVNQYGCGQLGNLQLRKPGEDYSDDPAVICRGHGTWIATHTNGTTTEAPNSNELSALISIPPGAVRRANQTGFQTGDYHITVRAHTYTLPTQEHAA